MAQKPGTPPVIGVIGGSGIYEIDSLKNAKWRRIESPFGEMSDDVLCGELEDQPIIFLPRHGRGHYIPPSALNFRANIDGLKRCGVTEILSVSACGSLKEGLPPGTFVVCDQFIDRTFAREKSFFDTGLVAHVGFYSILPFFVLTLFPFEHLVDLPLQCNFYYITMNKIP